jgi:DNA-binding MarR family transcriptional regulator
MFNRRKHTSDEELRELYINQGLTMNEIATRLNVSPSTIRRRLGELGVVSRSTGPKGSRILPHNEITEELLRELGGLALWGNRIWLRLAT